MYAVLQGTLAEETYRAAVELVDMVVDKLKEAESAMRKPIFGKLPHADFLKIISTLLGPRKAGGITLEKTKMHFEELTKELAKDEAQGTWGVTQKDIQYTSLFGEVSGAW